MGAVGMKDMGKGWQTVPRTSRENTEERSENLSLEVMGGREKQR